MGSFLENSFHTTLCEDLAQGDLERDFKDRETQVLRYIALLPAKTKAIFFYSIVSPQAKTVIVENGFLPLAKQSQTKPNNTKTHYLCVQILFDVLQEEHVNEAKVYKKLIKLPF